MLHFILLYNITVIFILSVSFNIPVFLYFKTKDAFLKKYILFFMPFILFTFSIIIEQYLIFNLNIRNFRLLYVLYFTSELFFTLSIYAVAFFSGYLFGFKHYKLINLIVFIVCAFLIFLIPFHTKIIHDNKDLLGYNRNYLSVISTFVFIIVLICFLIFGLKKYKKITKPGIKNIAKTALFLTLFFFPGTLIDFYKKIISYGPHNISERSTFLIHPIFYCILSMSCTFFIIKYYFKEYSLYIYEASIKSLMEEYGLSERETDVIKNLILGKSNGGIAGNLSISINTVKSHIKNIYEKLNVKSRFELISLVKNKNID